MKTTADRRQWTVDGGQLPEGTAPRVSVAQAKGLIEMALRPAFGGIGLVVRPRDEMGPCAVQATDQMITNLVKLGERLRGQRLEADAGKFLMIGHWVEVTDGPEKGNRAVVIKYLAGGGVLVKFYENCGTTTRKLTVHQRYLQPVLMQDYSPGSRLLSRWLRMDGLSKGHGMQVGISCVPVGVAAKCERRAKLWRDELDYDARRRGEDLADICPALCSSLTLYAGGGL